MDERFRAIEREHLLKACEEIYSGRFDRYSRSTKYSVRYKTGNLPPKAVISRAYFHATGKPLPVQGDEGFYGGRQSNDFLISKGFTIVDTASD